MTMNDYFVNSTSLDVRLDGKIKEEVRINELRYRVYTRVSDRVAVTEQYQIKERPRAEYYESSLTPTFLGEQIIGKENIEARLNGVPIEINGNDTEHYLNRTELVSLSIVNIADILEIDGSLEFFSEVDPYNIYMEITNFLSFVERNSHSVNYEPPDALMIDKFKTLREALSANAMLHSRKNEAELLGKDFFLKNIVKTTFSKNTLPETNNDVVMQDIYVDDISITDLETEETKRFNF